MERKHFLKSLLAGVASAPVLLAACGKEDSVTPTTTSTTPTTTTGTASGSCPVVPTETEGPFPTHAPSSYVRADITDGKAGYQLTATLTVTNSSSCAPLAGVLVDVWHCDAAGNCPAPAWPPWAAAPCKWARPPCP